MAALAALIALAAAVIWSVSSRNPWKPGRGGDFTLQSAGGPVSLADFRGKWVLLYFGYTYCPDICPTSLSVVAQSISGLDPAEQERVQGVFISVDPERDTPARLKEYAAFFHPRLVGMTGSPSEVAAVATLYGVRYRKAEGGAPGRYSVDHSSETFLIGPGGVLKETFPHGTTASAIVNAIRRYWPEPLKITGGKDSP